MKGKQFLLHYWWTHVLMKGKQFTCISEKIHFTSVYTWKTYVFITSGIFSKDFLKLYNFVIICSTAWLFWDVRETNPFLSFDVKPDMHSDISYLFNFIIQIPFYQRLYSRQNLLNTYKKLNLQPPTGQKQWTNNRLNLTIYFLF
jgi:hypothetical protein